VTLDEELRSALGAASSVPAAASAVVEHLLRAGLVLPSLYLERGGRLRCQAVRGYWQVFDGIPPDAGIIGRTFRTGQPTEIRGVVHSTSYLAAAPGVVDEVCVPIVAAGRVVGVLNVESTGGLRDDALAVTTAAAEGFADRLVALGGVPHESAAQRLARHAAVVGAAREPAQLWAAACAAAREVTGSSSAAIVLPAPGGGHQVACGAGPIGQRLAAAATPEALGAIATWVSSGSSCWTLNDAQGARFAGSDALRAAGAAAVLVVALHAACPGPDGGGFLLVADEQPSDLATDLVELLELLGAHLSSCARTLAVLDALRRQASRDPLTDLGHHATFQSALAAALGAGPVGRQVAVVVLDIDDFKAVNDAAGHPAGDALLRAAARVLSDVLRDGEQLYRIGGDEFATLLRVTTAGEARAVADRLLAAARAGLGATISVGVAVAGAGESPASLVTRADRALYAVKRSGRDGVRLAPAAVDCAG